MATEPLDVLGALLLDINRRWREVATPWQIADAEAILKPVPGEPRMHWTERPKGSSKSTDLGAMSIVWLLTQAKVGEEGYIVASDQDQANRLLNRARVIIKKSGLESHVKILGDAIRNTRSGAFVQALAADVSGSEGILSPWVVVDELARWKSTQGPRDLWTSIFSGHPKVPGARLVVLGHAGDPAHWSYKIRERARVSEKWRFTRIDGPTPWIDPEDLVEQQALLLPSQYAQRHLNKWEAGENRLTNPEDIAACVGDYEFLPKRSGYRYATGLDIGLVNDRTVATVCHRELNRVILDRQQVWAGTPDSPVHLGTVEEWLIEAHRQYGGPVILDPWQAIQLGQRLRANGIEVVEYAFSSQSIGRLAVTLYRLIKDHDLQIPNDEQLVDELVNVRLRQTSPGVFRIDHDEDKHDDRVISLALAAHRLVSRSGGQGTFAGSVMAKATVPDPLEPNPAVRRDAFSPWARPAGVAEVVDVGISRT